MKPRTSLIVKLALAALLLLCLADMPYGFYQFVRFIAMAAFAYFFFFFFKQNQEGLGFAFAALAILFQPFFKIALGRTIWNIVDVAVAIALICLAIVGYGKKEK